MATPAPTSAPAPMPPPFTLLELHTAAKVTISVAVLSVFGAGMIVLTFLLIKKVRNFRTRMLLFLSLADLGTASCYISGAVRVLSVDGLIASPGCEAQGFVLQVFHNIANCWIIFITLTLYINCFHAHIEVEKWENYFIASSILFPVIVACIGLAAFEYGPAGIWCWFAGESSFVAQQALWFSIGYSTLLFILFVYARISIKLLHLDKQLQRSTRTNTSKKLKKFAFYPFAYILIWCSGILRRIVEVNHPNSYPFLILQISFVPAQGILNFIGYFLQRRLHQHWFDYVKKNRKTQKSKDSTESSSLQASSTIPLTPPLTSSTMGLVSP